MSVQHRNAGECQETKEKPPDHTRSFLSAGNCFVTWSVCLFCVLGHGCMWTVWRRLKCEMRGRGNAAGFGSGRNCRLLLVGCLSRRSTGVDRDGHTVCDATRQDRSLLLFLAKYRGPHVKFLGLQLFNGTAHLRGVV